MPLTRREVLGLALLARCGVAPSYGDTDESDTFDTQELALDETLFPAGVMAGEATDSACMLWTQYKGTRALRLTVWNDNNFRVFRRTVGVVNTFALADVDGLAPNTRYRYEFSDGKKHSLRGNFRTLPALDSDEPLVFAGTCCTHAGRRAPFPVLSAAALREDVKFLIHGGDHVYTDGAESLEDYRRAYAETYRTSGYRALHQAFTYYGMWDDHDIASDWKGEEDDDTRVRLGKQVFFEHTPMRTQQMWRSMRWGTTAEFFFLDCRSERKPSTRHGRNAQYISPEQLDWLKQGLLTSPCPFKFIVNTVPIGNFKNLYDFKAYDRWEGYAAQRADLLDFMAGENVRGAYFLSGDFHCGFSGRLEETGPWARFHEIAWGPGGNRINPLYVLLNKPQWDFATGTNNFAVLKPDVANDSLTVEWIDENSDIIGSVEYRNS